MGTQPTIRVMLVDDHASVRKSLKACIMVADDLELVAEASNGLEAVQHCEHVQPDVILMDLFMPHVDGITATKLIHDRHPTIRILLLTSFKEDEPLEEALKAGASGYLMKEVTAQELIQAIHRVYEENPVHS